jgi:LacI family transcriptional regulator, galactose operon repressor
MAINPSRRLLVNKVTIRDVANHADVSVATVSHVINDSHYVSAELRERVLDAVEALNYHPNKVARALSRKAIPLFALIVPDISNPYWSSMSRAVQDITDEHDYSMIVCSSDGLLERETRFVRSLSGWISGLIFHPYHTTYEHLSQLVDSTIPVVILGDFATEEKGPANWDHVSSDNLESARLVTEHLIGLGHRRIAFIQGSTGTPSATKRLAGFRHAHDLAGLPVLEVLIVPGDYTQEGGRKAITTLLDMKDPPTAVFSANDLSALGALEAAKLRGYQIPKDLSIVGFDDIEEGAHAAPALTTISLSPRHVGTIIAETLIERLQGRAEPSRISIKGTLVVRESTAPPPPGPPAY